MSVSFREAFAYWFKLGFVSFGGPAGQISMMHHELVERRRWISERRFLHALNYCMVLPGPEAQQLATYIGWLMHGTWGGIAAGVLFVLPSLLLLITLSWIYLAFGDVPAVAGFLYGVKPAVTAIVLFAAYRIGRRALSGKVLWIAALLSFLAIFVFDVPFPFIVIGAGLVGFFGGHIAADSFRLGLPHVAHAQAQSTPLIDDDTATPDHARFERGRAARHAAVGLTLWGAGMTVLGVLFTWSGTLTQMAWFFTKAALMTFGGAYAVLPYVYQGAVEHFQWLTPVQMIDGLALGETTPGPLIMVVAFVGFVGAWAQQALGSDALLWAGIAGAVVATVFTFLPSFLFILVGAPLVEATRDEARFTAPLTAITAAVVGVIVNLAFFFAYHVFWPQGFAGQLDWAAVLVAVLAFFALVRLQIGVIPVIVACGVTGCLIRWLAG